MINYMKRGSTSLVIREIKITTRYCFTFTKIKDNNKCWRGCGEIAIHKHC